MNTILVLLLTLTMQPTLLDRSNLSNNCDTVTSQRSISEENINGGFAEGTVDLDFSAAVGMVDNRTASYPPCSEFGERFFSSGWLVSASVSQPFGLSVIENGKTVYTQNVVYNKQTARIRVQQTGSIIRYSLNGRLLFVSHHPEAGFTDLRAYYFGLVGNPLIGVQRKVTWRSILKTTTARQFAIR